MSKFAAFLEEAAQAVGQERAERFAQFMRERRRGQLVDPDFVRRELEFDPDIGAVLIEIGTETGLVEHVETIRCPHCEQREQLAEVRARAEEDGEAPCPSCERGIRDFEALPVERRVILGEEADIEAERWQAQRDARPRRRAAIVTAVDVELKAVHAQLAATGAVAAKTAKDGAVYYVAEVAGDEIDWELYAVIGGQTNPASAVATEAAIATLDLDVVLFVGVAGGIAEKGAELGDVVAATVVHDYAIGKETKDGYVPRALQYRASFPAEQVAHRAKVESDLPGGFVARVINAVPELARDEIEVHIEPIATGGKVVASTKSEAYKLIRATNDRAVAVETEGSGFHSALERHTGVDGIVIRGISDLIDGKGASDKEGWQRQAAAHAAAFAIQLLRLTQVPTL